MKNTTVEAFKKAIINHHLILSFEDYSVKEEDFLEVYKELKSNPIIQVVTLVGGESAMSLGNFSLVTAAISANLSCTQLILQNFELTSGLMGNLLTLSFKENFVVSFENVVIDENAEGLREFMQRIQQIGKCDIYKNVMEYNEYGVGAIEEKRTGDFDLSSLVGKGVNSLNIYSTSFRKLAALPDVINHNKFEELNIFEVDFNGDLFLNVLETIAKNINFRRLRLFTVSPGVSDFYVLEKLIGVVKGSENLETFMVDGLAYCSEKDKLYELLQVLASKRSLIELTLPYSPKLFSSSEVMGIYTKIINNSSKLKKLEMVSLINFIEAPEEGIEQRPEVDLGMLQLIEAIYLHPSIISLNKEFIKDPWVEKICKQTYMNLETLLEEKKRIIHDTPDEKDKDVIKLNRIRKFLRDNNLPSTFFASFNNKIPPLRQLCIKRAQYLLDKNAVNVERVKALPEELVKEFQFK